MMRKIWKQALGIGLIFVPLLTISILCLWSVENAFYVLSQTTFPPSETTTIPPIPIGFWEFLLGLVGSPVFYILLADLVCLITGTVGLIATGKRKHIR